MNPFLSTPEATAFWREQQQACEEARRLLVKTPDVSAFLAAGGRVDVVSDSLSDGFFTALLKDGDSIICAVYFSIRKDSLLRSDNGSGYISRLTAWLTEARDGARELPTAAQIARARIEVEVHDAPKRLEADNERPKYNIHKAC